MKGHEGFGFNIETVEPEPIFKYSFYDRSNPENIIELPFICQAFDSDSAYILYRGWCLENGTEPLTRESLSINQES
jgi:hypothetical protein